MKYPERVRASDGNFGVFADVQATPYSINYNSYPFLIENQVDTFVRILKPGTGKDADKLHPTEPDDPGIYKAIDRVTNRNKNKITIPYSILLGEVG